MSTTMTAAPQMDAAKLAQNAQTAKTVAEASMGKPSVIQPKYDGWRILAHREAEKVVLYTRTGKAHVGNLPLAESEIFEAFPEGTWLDGEAVALRVEDGKVINDWGVAQSVMSSGKLHPSHKQVTYMVFDLIMHGEVDARTLPYSARRGALEQIFERHEFQHMQLTAEFPATEESHALMLAQGFEGSIVRRLDAPYASNKRGHGLGKLKPQATMDAVIMGYKPGESGFAGYVGAIIFGQPDPATGKLVERGRASGMDWRTRVMLTKKGTEFIGTVVEIAHHGFMDDGFRHPQFKRFRPDRTPESVEWHDA